MAVSRQQAVANALRSTTNVPRYCAQWTRTMFVVAALGDHDRDGAADAEDMWKAAKHKHPGDYTVPAGVPVYWGGGSNDNGHIAVSLGNGMCRSTDAAGAGKVGTVPLDYPVRQWGMPYLGWSDDLYGNVIPNEDAETRAEIARLQAKVAEKVERRTTVRRELSRLVERVARKTATVERLTDEIGALRTRIQALRDSL